MALDLLPVDVELGEDGLHHVVGVVPVAAEQERGTPEVAHAGSGVALELRFVVRSHRRALSPAVTLVQVTTAAPGCMAPST